jgi:probable phosphoglycerate mutase
VKQLRATGGEAFAAAEAAGLDFHPPGGESPRLAMARLSHWSSTLTEPVVAVSHKAAIRALLAWATGWNMLGRPPHKLDWTCLHFFVAHGDGRVTVERLNVSLTS